MGKRDKATKAEVQSTKLNAFPAGSADTEYSQELVEDAEVAFSTKNKKKNKK